MARAAGGVALRDLLHLNCDVGRLCTTLLRVASGGLAAAPSRRTGPAAALARSGLRLLPACLFLRRRLPPALFRLRRCRVGPLSAAPELLGLSQCLRRSVRISSAHEAGLSLRREFTALYDISVPARHQIRTISTSPDLSVSRLTSSGARPPRFSAVPLCLGRCPLLGLMRCWRSSDIDGAVGVGKGYIAHDGALPPAYIFS